MSANQAVRAMRAQYRCKGWLRLPFKFKRALELLPLGALAISPFVAA
jgi:hypothetical protein